VVADVHQPPAASSSEPAPLPSGPPSSFDAALHFPGFIPPNDFFNPTADEGEELSFPVDVPAVSCKVVENVDS